MYRPMTIANPLYQRQSSWIGHRALNPDDDSLPDSTVISNQLEVMPEMTKRSQDAIKSVQKCFQIAKVTKRSKKRL